MLRFPSAHALAAKPIFRHSEDVGRPHEADDSYRDQPGRIWVELNGAADSLCFYGREDPQSARNPLMLLEGDAISKNRDTGQPEFGEQYLKSSPLKMQLDAQRLSIAMGRTVVNLARPGTNGSTGDHRERRRPREIALVKAALDQLRDEFKWSQVDLVGQSGGGTLVALLMARCDYIGNAVISSGNLAVWQRIRERGEQLDVTGFSDSVDPIDEVAGVAQHPPRTIIMLTDPLDQRVSASSQRFYASALKDAFKAVNLPDPLDHREITADEDEHHRLRMAALLAAAALPVPCRSN